MPTRQSILKIYADQFGVYEVAVAAPVWGYANAERLAAKLQPAIAMINRILHETDSATTRSTQ